MALYVSVVLIEVRLVAVECSHDAFQKVAQFIEGAQIIVLGFVALVLDVSDAFVFGLNRRGKVAVLDDQVYNGGRAHERDEGSARTEVLASHFHETTRLCRSHQEKEE